MVTPLIGKADPVICNLRVLKRTFAIMVLGQTSAAAFEALSNLRCFVIVAFSRRKWELAHLDRKRT
jgi:hypothetical protein